MEPSLLKSPDRLAPIVALVISLILFFGITDSQSRHETSSMLKATVQVELLDNTSYTLSVRDESGIVMVRSGIEVIDDSAIRYSSMVTLAVILGSIIAFFATQVLFRVVWVGSRQTRVKSQEDKQAADELVEAADLRKITAERFSQSRMLFAGIPMPDKTDTANLIICGSAGSGKSANIKETLVSLRATHRKAIVFDINGELISHFYRPDKDVILNPMDARSASWDVWCECNRSHDYLRMASALVPDHKMEEDWSTGARYVLARLAQEEGKKESPTTESLLEKIREISATEIAGILKETDAAPILAKWGEEQASTGIRGVLISSITPLQELSNDNYRFSVRRWTFNEADDSWLFISTHSDEIDILRPLTTLWMEFVCSTLMSLPVDHLRRIFVAIDDVTSLNQIPSLPDLMIQSRKQGVCTILGINSISELIDLYGTNQVQALSRACESWAALRTTDYNTANWISSKLGTTMQSTSVDLKGAEGKHSIRRELEVPVVSPEMIVELQDMQGFVRMGDKNPTAKFNSVQRSHPVISQPFISRVVPGAEGPVKREEEQKDQEEGQEKEAATATA